jgi:hypothetical protein
MSRISRVLWSSGAVGSDSVVLPLDSNRCSPIGVRANLQYAQEDHEQARQCPPSSPLVHPIPVGMRGWNAAPRHPFCPWQKPNIEPFIIQFISSPPGTWGGDSPPAIVEDFKTRHFSTKKGRPDRRFCLQEGVGWTDSSRPAKGQGIMLRV